MSELKEIQKDVKNEEQYVIRNSLCKQYIEGIKKDAEDRFVQWYRIYVKEKL